MIVDTQTNIAISTDQFYIQCELLEDLIQTARAKKFIFLGSVALTYLLGLQTICDEISDQNDLGKYSLENYLDDCEDYDGPECPGCTDPGCCKDCEYREVDNDN